jgi:hypothetical protein
VTQSWLKTEFHDHWTLSADEFTLLPGMTDKGLLGSGVLVPMEEKYTLEGSRAPFSIKPTRRNCWKIRHSVF